jgi:Domain of unknown function (DUF4328)
MNQLRDNTARAKQIISIFWIMLGITVVNIGSLAWQFSLLAGIQADPENYDEQTANISDTLQGILSIAYLGIFILAIVFFIKWFRRAYYNLHQLKWHNARYTEGWAAGSWFIPIISLWWPYQIMMDIWKGTQNAVRERLGEPQSAAIIGWWWAFYLISNIYGNFSARFGWDAKELDELISSTKIDLIGEVISIPAIILAIIVVRRTSNFERELFVHAETPEDSIFSDNYTAPTENI